MATSYNNPHVRSRISGYNVSVMNILTATRYSFIEGDTLIKISTEYINELAKWLKLFVPRQLDDLGKGLPNIHVINQLSKIEKSIYTSIELFMFGTELKYSTISFIPPIHMNKCNFSASVLKEADILTHLIIDDGEYWYE